MAETFLKEPNTYQLASVAAHIRDKLLHNWTLEQIQCGIRRVRSQ